MTLTAKRTAPRRAAAASSKRRSGKLVPILLVLLGVILLLYPVLATQFNNYKQQEFAHEYNSEVLSAEPDYLQSDFESAQKYNSTLGGVPILDPWLLKVAADPGSAAYKAYSAELNRFSAMARLRVPSVDIDLPVFHGTSEDVLARGVGHLYGTSLPVGGIGTHSVLTSHTGMPNATLFDHLTDVKEGDLIFVEVLGETLAYQVDQIKVILPNEIEDLVAEPGHDYLTIFTCTPYAVNTHRLLVRGVRVPFTPEIAPKEVKPFEAVFKLEPWMWGLLGGAGLGVALLIGIVVRDRRQGEPRARRMKLSS